MAKAIIIGRMGRVPVLYEPDNHVVNVPRYNITWTGIPNVASAVNKALQQLNNFDPVDVNVLIDMERRYKGVTK